MQPSKDISVFDFSGCGSDYGCLKSVLFVKFHHKPNYVPLIVSNSRADFHHANLFRSPGSCTVDDCDVIVSYRSDPDNSDNVYVELRSKQSTYDIGFVALGWSTDPIMVRVVSFSILVDSKKPRSQNFPLVNLGMEATSK